ncbi:MAG TPA: carbohydrate binding domain-containing protein [Candidatus Nitrosopolaris sp.]|nr:carbohydrate binding domain-containing protein [Candidatus Nitrosopolaris sp.]
MQSTSGSTSTSTTLQFASCSGGGSSLAGDYNSSGTTGNTITYTTAGAGIVIQDASTPLSGNLLTIQNNAATFNYLTLNLSSSVPHLKVYGASSTNYADIYYDAGSSTAYFTASSGTTSVGSGSGPVTINAGSGAAVTITGHATSTWSLDAGNLTIDVTSGSTPTLNLGTGAQAKNIFVGSATSGVAVDVEGATMDVGDSTLAKTIHIGGVDFAATETIAIGSNASSVETITVGTTNSTSSLALNSGSNNITLISNGASAGTVVKSNTNSSSAFQVDNSSGIGLFRVNTSSNNSNNLLTNPSIETGGSPPSGWAAKNGSGTSTPTQVSSPAYDGSYSMQVVTSGTATNAGVTQSLSLSTSTAYVLAVYVNSLSDFVSTTGAGTFEMGYGTGGSDNLCLTAQKVPAASWTRLTCSFTTAASLTSPYIYFKQTDSTPRTFFIDSAVLETDPNATSKWQAGQITLNGVINSPVIISPQQDSTNTFLVQNSEGINVFGVDTTDTNLVANPGLEVNTTGWGYNGTPSGSAGIFRDTSTPYLGVASLKLITTSTATDGAKFTFSPNTLLQASTTYAMSFYAKLSSGSLATLTFGRSENGSQTSCVTTGSINTTWQRYSCSFTVGGTIGATPYIYISPGTGTQTMWIDAVSLEPGSTVTPYGSSNIYLNGVITSPVNFQNKADSTTAFQIENAGSAVLFTADTADSRVVIGSNIQSNTTITLFQLNSDSNFNSDETTVGCSTSGSGTNLGAMYYNSTTEAIRACINGSWEDIVSTAALGLQLFGVVPDSGATPGDLLGITSQGSGPCKVYMGSATTAIRWTGCIAYSGGRKIVVPAQSSNQSVTLTSGHWEHVCLSGTAGAVTITDSTSETANLGTVSFPSATAPILCLADITVNGTAITAIYDVRTFTTTTKEFVNVITTAAPLGTIVQQTTTPGSVTKAAATANLASLKGVIVASAGTTTANTINAIIATNGPAYVKSSAGTVQAFVTEGATTAGYAITTTTQTSTIKDQNQYSVLGVAESTRSTTCSTTADDCRTSLLVNLSIQ